MTTEKSSKSQLAGEDLSPKKQDPLERRRQQNRLSQRNHRRKIRDRIAKLQERVIANELRTVAAFNGWDNPYGSSPLISPAHSCSPYLDVELSLASPSPPSLSTTPTTPFLSSDELTSPPLCLMDSSISEPNSLLEGHAHPFDTPTDLSLLSPVSNFGIPLAIYNRQDNELLHESMSSLEEGLSSQIPVNDKNSLFSIDPVLLYVATAKMTK
ncbi:hypothetical protein N7493_008466 [Penicillium malachiteum]|uniref:BZIP domain-containing protein n=1 Tax=Penicillium malachiteum TaxID=1324776 RepID=A0AAD6HHD2_9EURO|nr:hypothetical protein N7493_008466 [Penicillium malachiteum]